MSKSKLKEILDFHSESRLRVHTFGQFLVTIDNKDIDSKTWGRDKTIQLLQFLITSRHRKGLHKEQIVNRLWEEAGQKEGDRDFKVALHGVSKAMEPERKSRSESKYIVRQGLTYQLNFENISVDSQEMEDLIALGNNCLEEEENVAQKAYERSVEIYKGIYLPNRLYEDWANAERERLQVLALGAMTNLCEMILKKNPAEAIRLAQQILLIEPTWEDAYRYQMQAYIHKGNRPAAIKTFEKCKAVLDDEYGISPLPQTQELYKNIIKA